MIWRVISLWFDEKYLCNISKESLWFDEEYLLLMWFDEKYLYFLTRNIFVIWRERSLWFNEKKSLWFDEKNRNKVFIQFCCRYVDDDSIQPRLRPVHWRFLDQDSPAKYGSSIFLSSAMLRNINSNPMPRYKNASEKSHQLNMHDEFRLLKVKRLSLTLSFIPKSIFDSEGCSCGPRNYFSK